MRMGMVCVGRSHKKFMPYSDPEKQKEYFSNYWSRPEIIKRTKEHRLMNYKKATCVGRERKRLTDLKKAAVLQLGGKCCRCGYDKCLQALEFDHINPKEKKYEITGLLRAKKHLRPLLQEELKKCQLLCANCHREKTMANNLLNDAVIEPAEQGDLIQVTWLDIVENPTGNPDNAMPAVRVSFGLFWEIR